MLLHKTYCRHTFLLLIAARSLFGSGRRYAFRSVALLSQGKILSFSKHPAMFKKKFLLQLTWQLFLQKLVKCFRPRAQQTTEITVPQKLLFKNKYVQNLSETLAKCFEYGWLNLKSYCQWDWPELSQFSVEIVFHFPFGVKIFRQDGNSNNWLLYKKVLGHLGT